VAGPFVISVMCVLTVVVMGPYSVIALGTGYTLKRSYQDIFLTLVIGTSSVFIGCWIGGTLAFLLGRYMCRTKVKSWITKNKILTAVDSIMQTEGFKLVFLCRICLFIPYNLTNYVLGSTAVSIPAFIFGSLGELPLSLFYVYIG